MVMFIMGVMFMTGCGGSDEKALILSGQDPVAPGTCTEAGPAVISSNPTDGDVYVSTGTIGTYGKWITVNFSEVMNPTTIQSLSPGERLTFTLRVRNGAYVSGVVMMNAEYTAATFVTEQTLQTNTEYTATISKYAESAYGTSLSCNYKWSFKTAPVDTVGQAPVKLGTAGTYGIFAQRANVTLAVDSRVNGNVGLNPAGACNNCVVGTTVIGQVHNGGALAVQAQADIQAAYDEASVRATNACTLSSPSDISAAQASCNGFTPGPTYRPGLYRTADPIGFTGTITLDALGDSSAVFIFQTDSALTTATDSVVVLTNLAQAKNVFWVVGSAATLGVSSTFKGTVIANSAGITVNNGIDPTPRTDVQGRLFSGAAVTVSEFATVTVPAP
jgi:hypothetical protein